MSFEDKSIQCSDCGVSFTFSVKEQEFFQTKGFTNDPRRCTPCRQMKKTQVGNTWNIGNSINGGYGPNTYRARSLVK